jgi:hypothetical protein
LVLQGNREYQKKLNEDALESYTLALQYATGKSEALALAFANRSAVLALKGEHSAALRDIERSLNTGKYPEHLHVNNQISHSCLKTTVARIGTLCNRFNPNESSFKKQFNLKCAVT